MKVCRKCNVEKHPSFFYNDKSSPDGIESWCKECRTESRRSGPQQAQNRKWTLSAKYGLSLEDYQEMVEEQDHRCAICNKYVNDENGRTDRFAVDHDHNCCPGVYTCGKCIRGLLCHSCNLGLGKFNDDPKMLRSALRYLELKGGYHG